MKIGRSKGSVIPAERWVTWRNLARGDRNFRGRIQNRTSMILSMAHCIYMEYCPYHYHEKLEANYLRIASWWIEGITRGDGLQRTSCLKSCSFYFRQTTLPPGKTILTTLPPRTYIIPYLTLPFNTYPTPQLPFGGNFLQGLQALGREISGHSPLILQYC